jgi:NadR type nicotinamide-nucleotide adenylyltransferase
MEQKLKKYKSGLVLGKFMPLHYGHMFLITSAAKGCEKLTVLACSLKTEPIPGHLRYSWVKSFCSSYNEKNITAINITEELPQLPEEHPQFWEIWCDLIKKNCPDIDVIYSSEDYGFELAKRLGISHELVDKERIKHPISGTEIRNNPYDNWKQMYQGARPYFINRIYFLGPESTGKTTTSKLLAEKFDVNWVPEYGRILFEKKEGNIDLMDFHEIVIKQREIENNLAERTQDKFIICDTETITTKIFCELYYPNECYKLSEFFDYHIKQQLVNKCHFFVMAPQGTKFVQDGTRTVVPEENRNIHLQKIIQELDKWGISYTILSGDYDYRTSIVEQYVEKWLMKEDKITS